MTWCEQRKYVIAIVTLERTQVERLMRLRGISSTDTLLEILKEEFARFREDPKAKKVQPAWMPIVFQILPEPFSDKDGTVNSTLKIVRARIAELHAELIEYSYSPEGSRTDNPRNARVLREMFKLGR
jgi:long-chain acyl-CoA synthetase